MTNIRELKIPLSCVLSGYGSEPPVNQGRTARQSTGYRQLKKSFKRYKYERST